MDSSLAHEEIIYALDQLHADGITLYTRYGEDNYYLGHPDFHATWDLLDARRAVVFARPIHPVDTSLVNPSLPQPMIDYRATRTKPPARPGPHHLRHGTQLCKRQDHSVACRWHDPLSSPTACCNAALLCTMVHSVLRDERSL